jgi:hypothetical protein
VAFDDRLVREKKRQKVYAIGPLCRVPVTFTAPSATGLTMAKAAAGLWTGA